MPSLSPHICHDRDNSRLAPSENARKSQHRHTRADVSKCSAPQQNPSERASNASMLATCPMFVKSIFALYLLYLDSSLSSRHMAFICTRLPYVPRALPFTIRLLIPGPTRPRSRLSKVLLIHSFAFVLYAVCPPSRSSPCARPLVYKLYILRCSSLVCIPNKILPLSSLCSPLNPNSPTRARDARPCPKAKFPLSISYRSCDRHHSPLNTNATCPASTPISRELYQPHVTCSLVNLASLSTSVSNRENQS